MQASLALLTIALVTSTCFASDHTNTDEGLPIQVEDAYPVKYRSMELQFAARYEDLDEGGSRGVFIPELKVGLFRNSHLWLGGTILTDQDQDNSTTEFGFLYNFNTETLRTPAFAVVGKTEWDMDGAPDITARGIITKSCGVNRFNFNADYIDVGSPDPDERSSRYRFGLGWDRSIRLDTLLLADIFTQRSEIEGESAETMFEIGVRYQYDPDTVLDGGIGFGLSGGANSRNFTATLGFSISF